MSIKTYALGRCKTCKCVGAVTVKHDEESWKEDLAEFVEAGYEVSQFKTDKRMAISGCHDWCPDKP